MDIRRVAIDDHLPPPSDEDPGLAGRVKNLSALKAVAVGLDQVVNRCQADVCRYGHVDPGTAAHNAADFAEARKPLRVLETGLDVGRKMVASLEAQLGVKPPPPPEPAPTKRAAK